MPIDPRLSWSSVANALNGVATALNSGYLRVYDDSGSIPANADDSNGSNVLLAELRFGNPAFETCTAEDQGVASANAITMEDAALASGCATYGRYYASDGTTCKFQGLCGTSASDFVLSREGEGDPLEIVVDEAVHCTSATLRGVRQ
jgi:hypothetical protein